MIRQKDAAVSEAVGAILMISIVVLSVGIITVSLVSQMGVQQIPHVDISIIKDSTTGNYFFIHERGDPLDFNNTLIIFQRDGTNSKNYRVDSEIKYFNDTTFYPWTHGSFNLSSVLRVPYDEQGEITAMVQYNTTAAGNPMVLKSATFPDWV